MIIPMTFVQSMLSINFMHAIDAATIDLNLLKSFDALMRAPSVTVAASLAGLSQPAMSHALSRLRQLFDDELFVRGPGGLQPTARARDIARLISPSLENIRAALALSARFDPATTTRSFIAGVAEYAEIPLAGGLVAAFEAQAPSARLKLVTVSGKDFGTRLATAELDVALARLHDIPPGIETALAFRDPYVCLGRPGNPAFARPLTLEAYAALTHVLVSPRGIDTGSGDTALAAAGMPARRVGLVVSSYLALPLALAVSDHVAAVPSRTAARLKMGFGLASCPLPEGREVAVTMAWRRRAAQDPAITWFRDVIQEVLDGASP